MTAISSLGTHGAKATVVFTLLRTLSQRVSFQHNTNISRDEHFFGFEPVECLRSRF